jgi:hypothetical protein
VPRRAATLAIVTMLPLPWPHCLIFLRRFDRRMASSCTGAKFTQVADVQTFVAVH